MRIGLFAASAMAAALALAGCTTSGGPAQIEPAFAAMPDLAAAPVPVAKPSSELESYAVASLGDGEVPADLAQPVQSVAYAGPAVDGALPAPSPVVKSAVPDEAIAAASAPQVKAEPVTGTKRDRECLMRAMYFESNRSSRDGQLAVGSVVMHRLAAGNWGNSVCAVVGAPKQFAPGVMTRQMQGDTTDLAALADAILAGKRHPTLGKNVMYFHQAGLKFPYRNMKYVLVAGGNTFYYKSSRRRG